MINEEVLGGLKSALERGEPLKRAMTTLLNAGYKKDEIEECARMLVPPKEMAANGSLQQILSEEISGGMKSGLGRDESLKRAMSILFNAGYKKEEIAECVKLLGSQKETQIPYAPQAPVQAQVQQAPRVQMRFETPAQIRSPQPAVIQQPVQVQRQRPVQPQKSYAPYTQIQKVSSYNGAGITPREKAIIFILVFLLVFLIAGLGLIFLFKEQIINFFSSVFGQ